MTTLPTKPLPIKPNLQPERQLAQVEEARRDVEERLARLRGKIEGDLPFVTKSFTRNGAWAAIALGFAAGLALAYRARKKR